MCTYLYVEAGTPADRVSPSSGGATFSSDDDTDGDRDDDDEDEGKAAAMFVYHLMYL